MPPGVAGDNLQHPAELFQIVLHAPETPPREGGDHWYWLFLIVGASITSFWLWPAKAKVRIAQNSVNRARPASKGFLALFFIISHLLA